MVWSRSLACRPSPVLNACVVLQRTRGEKLMTAILSIAKARRAGSDRRGRGRRGHEGGATEQRRMKEDAGKGERQGGMERGREEKRCGPATGGRAGKKARSRHDEAEDEAPGIGSSCSDQRAGVGTPTVPLLPCCPSRCDRLGCRWRRASSIPPGLKASARATASSMSTRQLPSTVLF